MNRHVSTRPRAVSRLQAPVGAAALLTSLLTGLCASTLAAAPLGALLDTPSMELASGGGEESDGTDLGDGMLPLHPAHASPALEGLLREVVRRNPSLAALRHGVAAARHRVPQAGALDDPMAGIVLSNLPVESLSLDETPMTGIELRWSQRLPWPGKRALRREIAEIGVSMAREDVAETALRLIAQTRIAWYELGFLERALEINRRNREILQDLAEISEEKYAVGRGVQADAVRAQVSLSRILDRIVTLEARREAIRARLNALRDRPPEAELPPPPSLDRENLAIGQEELVALAESRRPVLARLRRAVEQAETREALARKQLRPDFTVAGGYRIRQDTPADPVDGEDFVTASVMVNVPLWSRNKQRARIAEEEEMARRARMLLDDARTTIRGRVDALTDRLEGLDREILLYEQGILDQARQSLASSRAAYEVDRLEFLSYLDAWKVVLDEEIQYARALTDYRQDLARLEAEVGAGVAEPAEPSAGREEVPR